MNIYYNYDNDIFPYDFLSDLFHGKYDLLAYMIIS